MTGAGCPPGHVTSDVSAAYLSQQPPTSGKVLSTTTTERQRSVGQYDVGDVMQLGGGNDYFHRHRRHQFRREDVPPRHQQEPMMMMMAPPPPASLDLAAGTCPARSDVEHIYESPQHDRAPPLTAADHCH